MVLFRFRSRVILTFAFLYFSLRNMHSRLDSSEQTMKEITKGLQRGKKFFSESPCTLISLAKTLLLLAINYNKNVDYP